MDNLNERGNPDQDIDELPKQQEFDINDIPQADFEDPYNISRPVTGEFEKN